MSIRELCLDDVSGMLEWMNDERVNRYFSFGGRVFSKDAVEAFIKSASEDTSSKHMAIVDENNRYAGTISLKNIDYSCKKAEYAIALKYEAQGRGLAKKATEEILDFGFNYLGLERVFLNVLSDNNRAIRLYENCGFSYEGEFKNHLCINGKARDIYWYAMLKEDYFKSENSEPFKAIQFKNLGDQRGELVVVEAMKDIPFKLERVFYIYGSDSEVIRGQHANRRSEFVLINLSGSSSVLIDTGKEKTIVELDEPNKGLYINKMVWKEMYNFSPDSVLLVLSNTKYDAHEYIRDYNQYMKEVGM